MGQRVLLSNIWQQSINDTWRYFLEATRVWPHYKQSYSYTLIYLFISGKCLRSQLIIPHQSSLLKTGQFGILLKSKVSIFPHRITYLDHFTSSLLLLAMDLFSNFFHNRTWGDLPSPDHCQGAGPRSSLSDTDTRDLPPCQQAGPVFSSPRVVWCTCVEYCRVAFPVYPIRL